MAQLTVIQISPFHYTQLLSGESNKLPVQGDLGVDFVGLGGGSFFRGGEGKGGERVDEKEISF